MKNKDLLKQENLELMQALSEAMKNDDNDAMAEAFTKFADGVQERIMEEYGLLKMSEQEFTGLDKEYLLRVRKESFGYSCLTDQRTYYLENYPMIVNEKGNIDEVTAMLVKGERV